MTTGKRDSAESTGSQVEPTTEVSEDSGQPNSNAGTVTKEEYNALLKRIEAFERQSQSTKDRAVRKVEQRVDELAGDFRTLLQTAQRENKSVDDLLTDIQVQEEREQRQLLRELAQTVKGGGFQKQPEGGTSVDSGVSGSGIVAELELDANDVRVKTFAAKSFGSADEAYREAAKLVKSIATKQPSDADRSSEETGKKVYASQQDKLMQEYKDKSKGLTGIRLMNLKKEMRQKGLNIY